MASGLNSVHTTARTAQVAADRLLRDLRGDLTGGSFQKRFMMTHFKRGTWPDG